ncbi:hypothetical protein D0T23_20625 [Duganella sp. BJB475]|nr:hypothetical protein D0T23_20625 [Duganella sp. BJB475]RFP29643.1 hypothetical protein D0T21_17380 [Duganella sp. BJB476]
MLRKKNSPALRYLDAVHCIAYSEVASELKANVQARGLDEVKQAEVLQAIFGVVACDPDIDGEPFEMGLPPYCPECAGQSASAWSITEPIEFIELEIPAPTFLLWTSLTTQEKRTRIWDSLRKCLPQSRVA